MSKKYRKYKLKTLFALLLLAGCFFLQAVPVKAQQMNRLIQTTTDEEMWNSYVNLGMTKTYIDEEDTLEEVQEKVKKSCVRFGSRIYSENNELLNKNVEIIRGSGFVINIDYDSMYIATNYHTFGVINPRIKYYPIFIDDELNEVSKKYNIEGNVLGYTNDSKLGDFAIIRIDISNVPYEYKTMFKSVPINKDTINTTIGTKGYFFHIEKNRSYILREYSIMNPIQEYYKSWAIENLYFQVNTNKSINGDSGSYCFDNKGNLLGIVTGGYNNKITYLLKPDTILTAYEEIVGSELE